jgi:SAM-dependent methyltransferase
MLDMARKDHWETVYSTKSAQSVGWFQPQAAVSLRLIREAQDNTAAVIDVGGGASTLVDGLLDAGYRDLTVLDLSAAALATARARLGATGGMGNSVRWLEADILQAELPARSYDIWHDRAVFHFLTDPAERARYVEQVRHAIRPGGHVIVASFAADGPEKCSGLPVVRYTPAALHAEFGAPFALLHHENEAHQTPGGSVQQFSYCVFQRISSA